MSVNLRGLIAKLNAPTRSAVEGAAGLCLSRTNYDVEIEHFFVKLLDATDSDLAAILKHFGVNRSRLADDLARALDRLKTGNARTPTLSPSLVNMLREAWVLGSVEYGAPRVRTGHVLLALLSVPELLRAVDFTKEFEKIPADVLKKDFVTITASSAEATAEIGSIDSVAAGASASGGSGTPKPGAGGRTPNLDQYCVDLTANAKSGKIDQVLGRDFEVRQVVDILTRRRQNNPILVGEAGVGKTAVVEGFARRIVDGTCRRRCATCCCCRSTWPCCRPVRGEGRIREPPQGPHRRGEELAHTHHSLHRRSAHDDRCGWTGRPERRRQSAQAGAGAW